MNFKSFSFSQDLLNALAELGFETLTPIQTAAIPAIRRNKDVLATAQTGTGKTAAFALPVIQRLLDTPASVRPRALVIAPTRELVEQIANNFKAFAKYTELRTVALYGGVNHAGQDSALQAGVDVVVATPGRLLDHIRRGNLSLAEVRYLVLDEADRMLDMGFIEDIRSVIGMVADDRQLMLFSATFPPAMKNFAMTVLKQPEIVQVSPENTTAETVRHVVYPVDESRKQELLSELIGKKNWQQVLVFVNMKEVADKVVAELKLDGITATVCHGDKKQSARRRALSEFLEGKVRVLVATEVAARGIDIVGLPRVVNFDLPFLAEDYVHRIGRTGRAGLSGQAISFVSREEEHTLINIETLIGQRIKRYYLPGYEVASREKLVDSLMKKPGKWKKGRTNRPNSNSQASAEAQVKNRLKIAQVRKSIKGQ
ncbi:DEAD/DEAH box helicase [Pseudoalteromonas fenneropenaei]|uniref:DEAD/DEAH box helicase n=1 Tax=Pseudoalteromonas fenneropenaei TaxID=1737459 RepID=A0ABV7CN09_9GAMM